MSQLLLQEKDIAEGVTVIDKEIESNQTLLHPHNRLGYKVNFERSTF